jgi:hypothetical protein
MNPEVHPAEYASLNQRFYSMSPYTYLQTRVSALVILSDPTSDPRRQGFKASFDSLQMSFVEVADEDRKKYAAIESTILVHHASETLLRLYLAHSKENPCPWLALSGLLNFRVFKDTIRTLRTQLDQEATVSDLLRVFTGLDTRDSFAGLSESRWSEHREALVLLVRHCIDVVLDDANIYNAAKHGLALGSDEIGMAFGPEGEDALIERSGPTVSYLELVGSSKSKHWHSSLRFVEPGVNLAWVALIMIRLEGLWAMAKFRRVAGAEEPSFIPLARGPIDDLLHKEAPNEVNLRGMSERLHEL